MVPLGLISVLFVVATASREIEFKNCKPASGTLSCKVKAVEVSGCRAPSSWVDAEGSVVQYQDKDMKRPCRLEVGAVLNFTITYEPGFTSDSMRSQFTLPDLQDCWGQQESCPVPFASQDACDLTKCSLPAGVQRRFHDTIIVNPEAARRPVNDMKIYQLRWKLWNSKNKKNSCCFNMPVQY